MYQIIRFLSTNDFDKYLCCWGPLLRLHCIILWKYLIFRVLDEFRQCYETQFTQSCGSEASQTLDNLMRVVLHDPHYLRYKYKPDCKLHKIPKRTHHRPELGIMSNSSSYEHNPSHMEMSSSGNSRHFPGYAHILIVMIVTTMLGLLRRWLFHYV